MSDPTKVYGGGVPQGGFDVEQANAGFGVSKEAESSYTPGEADATEPKVVSEGGPTQGKTYSKSANESFLMDSTYKTDMEVGRPGNGKTVNPDDISHADNS